MEELLENLENKLKKLTSHYDNLKCANQQLHNVKSVFAHENGLLLVKQQRAIKQIETLVSRLKSFKESP